MTSDEAPASFRVALTIDTEHPDRPTAPGVLDAILDALGDVSIRATFFVQGRWAEAEPSLAARIAAEGHLIGSHSFYHARVPLFSVSGLAADVRDAETAILEATGVDPRPWFRCPFGAGQDDPAVLDVLASLGYRDVGWDVDGCDWDGRTAAELEDCVVRETVAHGDGAVVLVHSWPRPTGTALPGILRRLTAAGAAFVGVDELERLPGTAPAAAGPTVPASA